MGWRKQNLIITAYTTFYLILTFIFKMQTNANNKYIRQTPSLWSETITSQGNMGGSATVWEI